MAGCYYDIIGAWGIVYSRVGERELPRVARFAEAVSVKSIAKFCFYDLRALKLWEREINIPSGFEIKIRFDEFLPNFWD